VGPGPGEVQRLVDWERADVAALLGDEPWPDSLARDLAGHDVAVVFTRSETLVGNVRARVPRVVARDPQPAPAMHAARWLAGAASELGLDPSPDPPSCSASPDEQERIRAWRERLPDRFLAMHPGSGSPRKNWPGPRFLELAARLRPHEQWLVVGGPADGDSLLPFRSRPECVLAEGLPLRELGALLSVAGVFVGNDSGVSHLAAAWGAPTVALFGPTDAQVWAPEGTRVRAVQSATAEMADITVEEVAGAVESAIG
jgi:ADP-heptose:LPS heptosyltransferase